MKQNENPRNTVFQKRIESSICEEIPLQNNPYLAEKVRYHGYEMMDLVQHVTPTKMIYLLMFGELPSDDQSELLEKWWLLSMHPGPRHPAVRAAMNVSIGKTYASHILPVGLSVMGGGHLGAIEVKDSMKFIKHHLVDDPEFMTLELAKNLDVNKEGDLRIAPGFGTLYGGRDPIMDRSMRFLSKLSGAGPVLNWALRFHEAIESLGHGVLVPGLAAAVFLELGVAELHAIGLFQMFTAPGILAHGNEMIGKPLTSIPFPKDEDYIYDGE